MEGKLEGAETILKVGKFAMMSVAVLYLEQEGVPQSQVRIL